MVSKTGINPNAMSIMDDCKINKKKVFENFLKLYSKKKEKELDFYTDFLKIFNKKINDRKKNVGVEFGVKANELNITLHFIKF